MQSNLFIPRQTNEYVCVYKPAGDFFYGPDTMHLKEGEWYEDWVPNDHTIIKHNDGTWHIFGITHPLVESLPLHKGIHEGEYASFHAISSATRFKDTLREHQYSDLPKVLSPKSRPDEILSNHAPYIVNKEGIYHMIYGPSPVRLALSYDLSKWKIKGELFHEREGARDPNILFHRGVYYLVYCTLRSVKLRKSVDLISWTEAETIFTSKTYDPESPSLIFYNNSFYLFVCSWDGKWDEMDIQGAYQHQSYVYHSPDPLKSGFDSENPISILQSHAPEIFQDEEGMWYISSVEWPYRGVSIDRLYWEKEQR